MAVSLRTTSDSIPIPPRGASLLEPLSEESIAGILSLFDNVVVLPQEATLVNSSVPIVPEEDALEAGFGFAHVNLNEPIENVFARIVHGVDPMEIDAVRNFGHDQVVPFDPMEIG